MSELDEASLQKIFRRARKVLQSEDLAQDFVVEIWKDVASGKKIRHLGGYIRLRLRKAIARKYNTPNHETLACELSNLAADAEDYIEQDELLAQIADDASFHNSCIAPSIEYSALTPFQAEIVSQLSSGISAPKIAENFDVYPRTIYNELKKIKERQLYYRFSPAKYIARTNPLPQIIHHPTKNRHVYAYMRADGTPYYIGKGTIRRVYSAAHGVTLPVDPKNIHIVARDMSDSDARQAEMLLIALYGRRDNNTGCLLNKTDGADGPAFNAALSLQKDKEFYDEHPDFKLIEGDGYWYSERNPFKEKQPQMVLQFPKQDTRSTIDPCYTKRMAEKAEVEKLRAAYEDAVKSGDYDAELRAMNEYNFARCKFAA